MTSSYVNDENEQVGLFLLNSPEGKKIWSMSHTSYDLEYLVRKYHIENGIINWEFEDNYDEGIDWVCFGDLFNNLNNSKL
jgi:homoserine trans-succinylase